MNAYESVEHISNRQPAYCPYCGESPAFGGLGKTRTGYRHHCPECGLEFVTILPEQ